MIGGMGYYVGRFVERLIQYPVLKMGCKYIRQVCLLQFLLF